MTKSDWLTIAMVTAVIMSAVATLLAPTLAIYIQLRTKRRGPKPDIAQGNIFQRFWRGVRIYWLAYVGMLFGLLTVAVGYVRAKNIVDRRSAVLMIIGFSAYVGFAILLIVNQMLDRLWDAVD